MTLTFWTPEQFQRQAWPSDPGYVWEPYIPTGGTVLLHGPRGASKSQLLWQLLNAVEEGVSLFGEKIQQGKALLICVDMPPQLLTLRFESSRLVQRFDLIGGNSFNVKSEGFKESAAYQTLQEAAARGYTLVAIDATGRVHGDSANDNATPNVVYSVFRELFPHAAILYNHHDHKRTTDRYGQFLPRGDDDSLGAVNWLNFANAVLHMYPISESLLQVEMTKSQVARLTAPLQLYRYPTTGELYRWNYQTQAMLARQFGGFLYLTGMETIKDEQDLPELLKKLRERGAFHNMTLGQLTGVYFGWYSARRWEREHPLIFKESEIYTNGAVEEETDNQQPNL